MASSVPNTRTECAIALSRVTLVVCAWALVWIGEAHGEDIPTAWHVSLGLYLGYATTAAVLVRSAAVIPAWWPLVSHGVDAVACLVWLELTGPLSVLAVVFASFLLASGALRWWSAGAVATGAAILIGSTAVSIITFDEGAWRALLDRTLLLAVATWLFAYLAVVHERRIRQLESLVGWPPSLPTERSALARDVIERAAQIIPAPRLLLVWEQREEPWIDVALWDEGRFSWRQEPPGTFDGMVPAELRLCSFLCHHASAPRPEVYCLEDQAVRIVRVYPIGRVITERVASEGVASFPVRAGTVDGRLFCFDQPDLLVEDLYAGETLAALIGARLAHAELLHEVRHSATLQDRVHLARDLHDGVLQALTGAALQLQAARRLLSTDRSAAAARLDELQQILAAEQVEIRAFIDDLQPPAGAAHGEIGLGGQLRALTSRLRRQWGVDVQLAMEPDPLLVPDTILPDIYFLVHEGVVNAARHARAAAVSVAILQTTDRLSIVVVDDGTGFGFAGRHTGDELMAQELGPTSLCRRVATLGGTLTIDSKATGSRIEIDLPLAARVR